MHRIFTTSVADVYPHYVAKVERKGRSKAELNQVIEWLTGYDQPALQERLDAGTTFEAFFAEAKLNPNATSITGVVCGVRVEDIDDPLMQRIRYLDKLVDELAKGRPIEKVLRAETPADAPTVAQRRRERPRPDRPAEVAVPERLADDNDQSFAPTALRAARQR